METKGLDGVKPAPNDPAILPPRVSNAIPHPKVSKRYLVEQIGRRERRNYYFFTTWFLESFSANVQN